MNVPELIDQMTALYLRRIIDSSTKDFPKPKESGARDRPVERGRVDRRRKDQSPAGRLEPSLLHPGSPT